MRPEMVSSGTAIRLTPECLTLPVREGSRESGKPPVRLFLGTEPAQQRAERVFLWSIERARDPGRIYQIWLMKRLAGFRTRGWTTGFTNYRFAIPHFAGGTGRAIYNDVDQIYLADPGELFDLALDAHGFLAIAPDDSSVMLLDCARMAAIWSLERAQGRSKDELLREALAIPGLYGPLAGDWNARDGEYRAGRSKLLHYTTLHTQPWRPFPAQLVYQENQHADLWRDLEREADAAGYQPFTSARPSARYVELGSPRQLEAAPDDDVPWLLDERFRAGPVRERIRCEPAGRGRAAATARSRGWWTNRFEAASRRHPKVPWEVELLAPGGSGTWHRAGGPRTSPQPPSVWVLADDRPGNTTQSIGLADALGWPYEIKRLRMTLRARLHNRLLGASRAGIDVARSAPLAPPWPELVIAAGRRTAPVALWIREQSQGRTRLVQLGRNGADLADLFDLAVTPGYCRLFPHPNRIETSTTLHAISRTRLSQAGASWRQRLEAAPAPRIALLVGGTSGQYRLGPAVARRLAQDVMRFAKESGGSVFATTSRRLSPAAGDALFGALSDGAFVHRWKPDDADNPYLAFLALADAIVITGDSESMLAEATALGRPVYVYPLPERPSFRLLRALREPVVARAQALPSNRRGTPRPQQGLEYFCARLIERGFVRPTRDLDRLHQELYRRGVARPFGAPLAPPTGAPAGDLEAVSARVRALMGMV
jgi:mitochondrial fission protein ELM1